MLLDCTPPRHCGGIREDFRLHEMQRVPRSHAANQPCRLNVFADAIAGSEDVADNDDSTGFLPPNFVRTWMIQESIGVFAAQFSNHLRDDSFTTNFRLGGLC